ncbi:MAG TPA: arylsulfotransferase family protein [Thermoanaerobaculia bacterium]
MNPEEIEVEAARSGRRRIAAGVALALLVAVSSAGYGALARSHRLFPYAILSRRLHAHAQRHEERPGNDPIVRTAKIAKLASLPYARGYRPASAGAVIRAHEKSLADDGLNFFTSGHAPAAFLMDMDGRMIQSWTADAPKSFPGLTLGEDERGRSIRRARLQSDGSILAMFEDVGLVHLDSASRVLWSWRGPVHSDFAVGEDGRIWVLTRETRTVPDLNHRGPVREDFLVELTREGRFLRQISLIEGFRRSACSPYLHVLPPGPEILETVSIQILDGTLAGRSRAFRAGNLLLSVKGLNAVGVLDPESGSIVWALSGQWYAQHSASLLRNNHLLLFDNLGSMREASRILEVDPFTQEILWAFGRQRGEELLSETGGFVQRLENGNTLVIESNSGRVIEITPDHRVAWEFVNPNRVGKNGELVATIPFMERVSRDFRSLGESGPGSSFRSTPRTRRAWSREKASGAAG